MNEKVKSIEARRHGLNSDISVVGHPDRAANAPVGGRPPFASVAFSLKLVPGPISKRAVRTVAALCLSAVAVAPLATAGDWRFGVELRPFSVQIFPSLLPQVSQIPASLRTVPINPADAGAGTPVLIPVSVVQPGTYAPLNITVAPEMSYRRFTLRAGAVLSPLAAAPTAKEGSYGSTREQNYQGEGRTVGAALVYYAALVRPSPVPGAMGELEVRARSHLSAFVGYQFSAHNVEVQSGWDRYDELTRRSTAVLSHDVLQQAYAGLRWSQSPAQRMRKSVFVYSGPAFVQASPTALAGSTVFKYSNRPLFIGIGFGLDWGRR